MVVNHAPPAVLNPPLIPPWPKQASKEQFMVPSRILNNGPEHAPRTQHGTATLSMSQCLMKETKQAVFSCC